MLSLLLPSPLSLTDIIHSPLPLGPLHLQVFLTGVTTLGIASSLTPDYSSKVTISSRPFETLLLKAAHPLPLTPPPLPSPVFFILLGGKCHREQQCVYASF